MCVDESIDRYAAKSAHAQSSEGETHIIGHLPRIFFNRHSRALAYLLIFPDQFLVGWLAF